MNNPDKNHILLCSNCRKPFPRDAKRIDVVEGRVTFHFCSYMCRDEFLNFEKDLKNGQA
jgi:hypothetical protein